MMHEWRVGFKYNRWQVNATIWLEAMTELEKLRCRGGPKGLAKKQKVCKISHVQIVKKEVDCQAVLKAIEENPSLTTPTIQFFNSKKSEFYGCGIDLLPEKWQEGA
ncbi:hypothetical protein KIN20_010463 [Parelaphostrongylus tenuis]|uniref:Uncharacterized protein n=1 Tax=Parelaphostrongylus tenuis TaxID=148309 RepID=A0AAD5QLF5_PARTN|nr:hypothetical protein KIN20_010463 [Parelaphostrongylus tenuis]